ncbi:MAG: hypothetical protein M3Q45_03115, partial [Chloroflexota bacterium]|nr:hypothetical protein [Chloroflexota bacterium]
MWRYKPYLRGAMLGWVLLCLTACTLPFASPPTSTPPVVSNANEGFSARLLLALSQHDYPQLQTMMDNSFTIAAWRAEGSVLPPAVALVQLRNNYISPNTTITLKTDQDLTALLDGTDPLRRWGPDVNASEALYVTGLGAEGQDEALLIVAQNAAGAFYWHGMLVATGGFAQSAVVATPVLTVTLPSPATALPSATALPTATPQPAPTPTPTLVAQTNTAQRIQFASGATSATVAGMVQFPGRTEYLIRALAGQQMTVEIAAPGDAVNFAIVGVGDGQPYKRLESEDRTWTGTLPTTQDYALAVATTGDKANFILRVTIVTPAQSMAPPQRISFAPGTTAGTVQDIIQGAQKNQYVLRALAGQT